MPADDRIPVVVAAGQAIERDATVSPVELAARASEIALEQAGALRSRISLLSMVNVFSGAGVSPATRVARRLGLSTVRTEVTTIGGNTPQWLVNRAAAWISAGKAETVLITGAEAQRSIRRSSTRRAPGFTGLPLPGLEQRDLEQRKWEEDGGEAAPDPIVGDDRPGAGQAELNAGLVAPVHLYALFESVIAHRAGRSFSEHRSALGELMAPFTEVASRHPFAWFPEARTPTELSEVSADNRLVSEPYPKRMCAMLGVDQGAAVVVTSLEAARAARVADGALFCWSGADACDVWFPAARPDPGSSPGIRAATSAALEASRIAVDDVTAIDLYSCFPCVVEMAVRALGISEHDERGLTVTGGLPYFGGPGNNYTLHAIATMADRLKEPGGIGLVTGLGWYATKHSVGIYGSRPPEDGWRSGDTRVAQRAIDASAVEVADAAEVAQHARHGATVVGATVVAATVVGATEAGGRDGEPTAAPVIARLDDGRHLALAAEETELRDLAGRNLVGERVLVSGSPPRYHVK
ncbi:MAG: acetyl-CoA acetyltransferase [Acidimicrobiales bacterium]|jgi:acetyl-CoA C-acetyltransferase